MKALLLALALSPATAQDAPAIVQIDPSCFVMADIEKQVCPMHHGKATVFVVYSYSPEGFTARTFSQHSWKAESARLLQLAALTARLRQGAEKIKAMEAALPGPPEVVAK